MAAERYDFRAFVVGLADFRIRSIACSARHSRVTGRFAPLPFNQILTMARGLQPDAEQLVFVAGLASIDSIALSVALNAASALPKLEVVVIREMTYADMLAKGDDPLQMYLSDIFTISANLAGVPAISIPCGLSLEGLPIGLQLIGRPFEEESLLRAAYAYEQSTQWRAKKPNIR